MTYTIIYKKRKSIAIVITKTSQIEVRAPFKTNPKIIENFLLKKQDWIEKTILKQQKNLENQSVSKEHFLFNDAVLPKVNLENLKEISNQYLAIYIQKQVQKYQEIMKLEKVEIDLEFKKYKTKWGSCSYKKLIRSSFFLPKNVVLKFNNWLAVFDPNIVDYVIIHELAHIYQNNHSSKFWKVVEQFYPNYKQARKTLTETGRVLLHG